MRSEFRTGAVFLLILLAYCAAVGAATYTVTSAGDTSATGTLRWALTSAYTNPGLDQINFNLAIPYTIQPTGELPRQYSPGGPIRIDGSTQPGYSNVPLVKIIGSSAPEFSYGLFIDMLSNCVVKGVQVCGWENGIYLQNTLGSTVECCFVMSNVSAGITLNNSSGNMIGGTGTVSRNLVSANGYAGIFLINGSESNTLIRNYVGTDYSGLSGVPNGRGIELSDSSWNIVGGTSSGEYNLISGNGGVGVSIRNGSTGNRIIGNYIGTDFTGHNELSNTTYGLEINAPSNTVGGEQTGAGNLISGNRLTGVFLSTTNARGNSIVGNHIGVDLEGDAALANGLHGMYLDDGACNNFIGGTNAGSRNIISGNLQYGIFFHTYGVNSTGNVIRGNFIGTDHSGNTALPNGYDGLYIETPANRIGGYGSREGNVISGNAQDGVRIIGTNAWGNAIQGNIIGLSSNGLTQVSNYWHGVAVYSAPRALIGGTNTARNIISGNGWNGVYLVDTGCYSTVIQGNYIGTDITGTNAIGNGWAGILLDSAQSNTIGGLVSGTRNVISGNGQSGVFLQNSSDNTLINSYIGTDANGASALGNLQYGVALQGRSAFNRIGSTNSGNTYNLISANARDGILLEQSNVHHTIIQNNAIGSDLYIGPLGNGRHGILINGSLSNLVGGTTNTLANFVAYNSTAGVSVEGPDAIGNTLLGNRITRNQGLGIDLHLEGVTTNDNLDPDTGPNRLQNFPVLLSASNNGSSIRITGTLNSTPNSDFKIECFGDTVWNTYGHGDAVMILGALSPIRTDAGGNVAFTGSFPVASLAMQFVTATATDTNRGDTSEFSHNFLLDSDGDGMSDGWEYEHFHSITGATASADDDTDHVSNLDEFLANTDPTNINSLLMMKMQRIGASMLIGATSSTERVYTFEYKDDLGAPGSPSWNVGSGYTRLSGNGSELWRTNDALATSRVYRVWAILP